MADKKLEQLRKENSGLLKKIDELNEGFKELQSVQSKMATKHDTAKFLDWINDEFEDLKDYKDFRSNFQTQLDSLSQSLDVITKQAYRIEESIESMERYSYQYNIKIVGVPQTTRFEAAEKTSELCIDLFHKIGATNIIINDIYIAHRIPNHRAINSTAPPAIICKFTRRLARESVMNRKKYTNNVTAQDSKIWPASQIKVSIFDHLTPRQQELLHECKKSQCDHGYKFCWVKKFCNLLALWGRRRCYSHHIKR